MGLTQAQKTLLEKARTTGGSDFAVPLSDAVCCYLIAIIVCDLELGHRFPELPKAPNPLFGKDRLETLTLPNLDFWELAERLLEADPNADTYFSCLAMLHKFRLKYERILERQAIPTMDQVGPRGLLQNRTMAPRALTGFLLWRKWMFDIDNRAGQETGYLFEPIVAHSLGGAPFSAAKSPIRRQNDSRKGRQVDCVRNQRAYEIKLRVTIAASGQGRWQEELDFPSDARASGYTPVLIVFDPTPNDKQEALKAAFLAKQGEVFIGGEAWEHLESVAGKTMSRFIERYVRDPMKALLSEVPSDGLPDLTLSMSRTELCINVGGEESKIRRASSCQQDIGSEEPEIPDDVEDA
jgi:hypothetical protein